LPGICAACKETSRKILAAAAIPEIVEPEARQRRMTAVELSPTMKSLGGEFEMEPETTEIATVDALKVRQMPEDPNCGNPVHAAREKGDCAVQ
jgi:hypothetical protein